MIIDLILDRYDGDAYDPKEFYDMVMEYEEGTDYPISTALDGGEEEDIRRELCAYIDDGNYNPKIKDFINSVKGLDGDDGKDYSKVLNILGESKKRFECSMQKRVESFKKNEAAFLDGSMSNAEFMSKIVDNAPNSLVFNKNNDSSKNTYTISANPDFGKSSRHTLIGLNADGDEYEVYTSLYNNDAMTNPRAGKSFVFKVGSDWNTFITMVKELFGFVGDYIKRGSQKESKKSESSDEQIEHGDSCHIFIEDEPNFQVSFRDENDKEYTFYVNAENVDSAIDSAYHEFSLNHGLSIKGEVYLEDDIPAGERNNYIEVNTNYAPKVNIAADPYDGSGIRVTRVPDYLLPAFVNGDTSGLEDEDLNSLEELEKELEAEGINPSLTFPVCGPDGEYWDNDEFGDGVLCSARV
jgi:hypothetical protein